MTTYPKFAFIKARWHGDIVDQALLGFEERLQELGFSNSVKSFDVPGAFEMPLLTQKLAMRGEYDGIVAAALVVDGGIYRHDFVAQAVVTSLMDVQLRTNVPVFSVSPTPHHFQSKYEHEQFYFQHFVQKGREAADAALQIWKLYSEQFADEGAAAA